MNILFPDRVYVESQQAVPEGVRYSWTWRADHCATTLHLTNPTPEQLAHARQHLKPAAPAPK
jgi:hypothetical protein